jgi:regulator of protease activity HflC (stomatin/prohibitin superfamily)
MTPKKVALTVIVLLIILLGGSSFFYVDQRVQALVLQFGEPVKLIKEPVYSLKFL